MALYARNDFRSGITLKWNKMIAVRFPDVGVHLLWIPLTGSSITGFVKIKQNKKIHAFTFCHRHVPRAALALQYHHRTAEGNTTE